MFSEFLLALCLFPIPLVLLITGIKTIGQSEKKQIRNIVVMAVESDEQKLVSLHITALKHVVLQKRFKFKWLTQYNFILYSNRKERKN